MIISKKIMFSLLAIGLMALLVGGATFALFTSTTSNEGNTFTAGTVVIDSTNDGAVFSADAFIANLAPGDTGSGTVTVQNTGSLDAWVKIDSMTGTGALFEGTYPVALSESNGAVLVAAGSTADFTVNYSFPLEADDSYQGATGTATITLKAVQARNNTNAGGTGPISW